MAIVNFGSINIDHVYRVPYFVQAGETLAATTYSKGLGGKGLNQTVALQRAGATVTHVGCIGADDVWLREQLSCLNIDAIEIDVPTGHALIQVNPDGENCIVLCAGANHGLSVEMIDAQLARTDVQWILLQNETNLVEDIIVKSHAAGKRIAFNPAPCHADLASLPLHLIDTLVVNEIEAVQLTGAADLASALVELRSRGCNVVLTMGGDGVRYLGEAGEFFVPAAKVEVVDTTAAGDTFVGYYLAGLMQDLTVPQALLLATQAAAITVSRLGASSAIPFFNEINRDVK